MTRSKLEQLDDFLTAVGREHEEVMLLEELDGFLAGVVVCPEMIPPSRWMPHIWSEAGDGKHAPVFTDLDQINRVLGLIMDHYNSIARSLLPGQGPYEPVFGIDMVNDDVIWELWMAGFERALRLSPASWLAIPESGDELAIEALSGLRSLIPLAISVQSMPHETDDVLVAAAPDLIPEWVETLSHWRLAKRAAQTPRPAASANQIGRNDPCPCGSGRKYKKCHGAN
jgi:uncharacterized protein